MLGQVLLAQRMGKDPGHRGSRRRAARVATATAAALMGMECEVFYGHRDTRRQALNVYRMWSCWGPRFTRWNARHRYPEGRGQRSHEGNGLPGWMTPLMYWAP